MNRTSAAIIAVGWFGALALATMRPAHGEDAPGLALFKKNGCNECHAIAALGVEMDVKKKATAPAAETSETKKKKKEAPDLSGVGLEHEAKWISAYLNKEEMKDGEKHEKRFKGSEADRRTIAMWLGTLKTEAKKSPAGATPAGEADAEGDGKSKDDGS